jgi:hypothetical protein
VRLVKLFAKVGAIGIVEFSETGEGRFEPLRRKRIHRNKTVKGNPGHLHRERRREGLCPRSRTTVSRTFP